LAGSSFSTKNNFEKNFLKDFGSNNLTNGGPSPCSSEHQQHHDFIKTELKTKVQILKTCVPLSEQELSLREMAECTGIAKSTIQETLRVQPRPVKRKSGFAPYGYIYFDGKIILDPKEQLVFRNILKLHELGKSYQNIANELNAKKITTRFGKLWGKSIIRSLVLRERINQPYHLGSPSNMLIKSKC
jgi:hypothetical protein